MSDERLRSRRAWMSRLSEEDARELLADGAPQLPVGRLTRPPGLSELDAWEIDDEWIVRFALSEQDALKLRREHSLLSEIGEGLPVAVPKVVHVSDGPVPFVVHRKIIGESGEVLRPPADREGAVADVIGQTLAAVHATASSIATKARLVRASPVTPEALFERMRAVAPSLLTHPGVPEEVLDYLEGRVSSPRPSDATAVLHGDLKGEHLLFGPGGRELMGIIDWADVKLGDPASDFSGIVCWNGENFTREVLASYGGSDDSLAERAVFNARCASLIGFGERLTGANDWPLPLALSMVRRSFDVSR